MATTTTTRSRGQQQQHRQQDRHNRKSTKKQPDISRTVEVLYVQQRNRGDPPIIITNDRFGNNMIDLTQPSIQHHNYYNDTYS